MPILANEIILRLTTKSGSAGDTLTSTPADSLGKYVSTTALGTGQGALFDDISNAENIALTKDYRCVAVLNSNPSLTLTAAVVYIASDVAGGANIDLWVDSTAVSAKGSASAQALSIANETTAPAGATWAAPTSIGTGLALGDIGPNQVKCFWVRRTPTNSAAASDGVTFGIAGTTAP